MRVCTPICAIGEVGPLWGGDKGLPAVESWGVLQDLIPDVGQVVLSAVPFERWLIDLNEHGLLGGPSNTMHSPPHN